MGLRRAARSARSRSGESSPRSRPCTSQISHSGLVRSSCCANTRLARFFSCSSLPGGGSAVARTWYSRLKCGSSTQTGRPWFERHEAQLLPEARHEREPAPRCARAAPRRSAAGPRRSSPRRRACATRRPRGAGTTSRALSGGLPAWAVNLPGFCAESKSAGRAACVPRRRGERGREPGRSRDASPGRRRRAARVGAHLVAHGRRLEVVRAALRQLVRASGRGAGSPPSRPRSRSCGLVAERHEPPPHDVGDRLGDARRAARARLGRDDREPQAAEVAALSSTRMRPRIERATHRHERARRRRVRRPLRVRSGDLEQHDRQAAGVALRPARARGRAASSSRCAVEEAGLVDRVA